MCLVSQHLNDTICALATPPGVGGLAVIRCAGRLAFELCDRDFNSRVRLADAADHTIHYGWWEHDGVRVDSVTCSVFRAPHSYTGDDVIEIGCHGGPHVTAQIIRSLLDNGARLAEPGEFTKRAFLNRKLDLTQVEAVADLIHAQSRMGAQTAARQLAGGFTRRLAALRQHLLDVCGLLELELDFSEEDVEFVDRTALLAALTDGNAIADQLAASAASAEILRSGFYVAVVGYPNAGKSSLFNALLDRERAIVSDIAGTTRDYLEESIFLEGYTVRLYDTAGLRSSDDTIEMQGVRLTTSLVEQSNLILVVNDASLGKHHSDALVSSLQDIAGTRPIVIVHNKSDLLEDPAAFSEKGSVAVSTIRGTGLESLRQALLEYARSSSEGVSDVLINGRQASILRDVSASCSSARAGILEGRSMDYVAVDVRAAIRYLGDISGETWSPDVLDTIFSRFCIGK
ncbi:MAG: tRNA uridine-5-carboxymethylaminomethyl(34) synthesis GTPase MnmE [Candidatus Kapabacteria bacterium]|nr:tRNA uridine-5-carboxymethylaminomethyl(34) synthesis GTPase MnmE [Candidatus Kapabacteria bacterium]